MDAHGPDFIVSELLSELKAENTRKDSQIKSLHKVVATTIVIMVATVLATIGGFLWYLNQYDFSSSDTTTNNAEGVYALIDSEGNVVGTDLTAEDIEGLMEGLANGESK